MTPPPEIGGNVKRITQTKENRDAVRAGTLLPAAYEQIKKSYYRYGLPGLAITMHARELALISDIDDLHERVNSTAGMVKIMLAFRIQQDGHAKTLGEAITFAEDRAKVAELYPELTAWAWADEEIE